MIGTKFDGATLENAKLNSTYCKDASFVGANCFETEFISAKLTNAKFNDCNLLWANFKKTKGHLDVTSFDGADVGYADFKLSSCISQAHLYKAKNVDKAVHVPPPAQNKKIGQSMNNGNGLSKGNSASSHQQQQQGHGQGGKSGTPIGHNKFNLKMDEAMDMGISDINARKNSNVSNNSHTYGYGNHISASNDSGSFSNNGNYHITGRSSSSAVNDYINSMNASNNSHR